jgi:uncharacterized protein (TIGR02145 family)
MSRVFLLLSVCFFFLENLLGQEQQQSLPGVEQISSKRTNYNLEEIKVRWKKAALENCAGVPCVVTPSSTCGTPNVSDIDGNSYNTVSIGTQCWTTTNLKVTKYNDGTLIFDGTLFNNGGFAGLGGLGTGALSGASSYVATYGYLYNWYAVNNSRKLCPVGWHVPTDGEWTSLIQFIDNPTVINPSIIGVQSASAGGKLKAIGTPWNSGSPSTDNYGFTALPGGARDSGGAFFGVANYAFFWSATESNPSDNAAWYRSFEFSNTNVGRSAAPNNVKRAAFSVRCLED